MLVLSRRPTESIRFPQLGISVSIVSIKGKRVQVGIEAPPEIHVIRNELEPSANTEANRTQSTHEHRNRLNRAMLGLHLAQKQLAAGQIESADKTLSTALVRLAEPDAATKTVPPANDQLFDGLEAPVSSSRSSSQHTSETNKCIDILLVEDDPNEQALLCGLLEMEGYRVHTASNGHEAIECLKQVTPKFVLLDMLMPECDGRETMQLIRQNPALKNVPIFAVSGSSPDSVGLSIGSEGVEDWFPKPLDAPRLVKHMRHQIANSCAL